MLWKNWLTKYKTNETHLTWLDAEMSRILNSDWPRNKSERWRMYREALWWYLRFIQETRRQSCTQRKRKCKRQHYMCEMFPVITRRWTMTFFMISYKHLMYRRHIPSVTSILLRKISSEHNHASIIITRWKILKK